MATSLVPPGFNASTPQSPVAETSPAASSTNISSSQILIERSDIDKSLKALEGLVSLLYDYTQLWQGLVSLDKKLVKAFKEAGGLKNVEWPNTVLLTSSMIFDSVQEVDSKFSKLVEREYETCTQELKKWIKKLKKEDKALDEYTNAANAKIKAAGQAYEKKAKKGISSSPSGPSLDSYSALLSTVSASVSSAKHQHALFTSTRHVTALYTISGSVGRIADAQWMKTCDLLRRCGSHVGTLGESRSYVEAGWRGGAVVDLPLNLPIHESSVASPPTISPATSPIEPPLSKYPNARVPSSDPFVPSIGHTNAKQLSSKAPSKPAPNSHDLLETIAKELKSSADDVPPNPQDGVQKRTTADAESSQPGMPEPKSTGTSADTTKPQQTGEAKTLPDDKHDTVKITNSTGTTRTTATTDTTKTDATQSSNGTSAKDTVSGDSDFKDPTNQTTSPTIRDRSQPLLSSSRPVGEYGPGGPAKPDPIQSPPLNTSMGPISPTKTQEGETGTYFSSAVKPMPKSPVEISSPTPIFATHSTTSQGAPAMPQAHPSLPHAPASYAGRAMGRTRSIDSTASNGSLVAAMRDRYNTTSPPPTSMPPSARRETFSGREREGGRVSDMASRFTPIEGPLEYDPRYPRSGFPASPPPFGRGLTDNSSRSGDSLPIRTPLTRSSVDEFGTSFSAVTPARRPGELMDRRQPPMPSHMVAGPSYDMRFSELELQERELELKRRELQLAREREALKARERGHDFHEDSEKEGSAYGDWRRRGGEDERYRLGDTGYESASSRDVRPGPYGRTVSRREDEAYGYDAGTPRMSATNPSGSYRDRAFTTGSRNPGSNVPYNDISTGLGVMGLGLPPGAGPSARHSRESLPLAAEPTSFLGPPRSTAPSAVSRSREPSPRRSADMANAHTAPTARHNEKEKEKGGTWLGKGLKRFSMPLGAGSNN